MRIKYAIAGEPHELGMADSEDLTELCSKVEELLRDKHPQLAGQDFLTERVADAMLNSLAMDGQEAELGDLA